MSFKSHALHHISIITVLSWILDVCNWVCVDRIGLGWAHDAISFACHMFMHSPCIHALFLIYLLYLKCVGIFWLSLSLPLSFLFTLVMFIAPKRKSTPSQNPLRFGYRLPLILLLISGSVMRMPERTSRRTFLDEVFIWNVESFWWTSPTLTFPMSFTVGVGCHCVTSRSHVRPCWSRSFTPTCMDLII